MCKNYLAGFCPDGSDCKFMHPRFELPPASDPKELPKRPPVCHNCGDLGHKASHCPKLPPEQRELERQNTLKNTTYNHHAQQRLISHMKDQKDLPDNNSEAPPAEMPNPHPHPHPRPHHPKWNNPGHHSHHHNQPRPPFQPRKLEEITCFKCGMKGHYANRCYSFLNNNFEPNNKQ